jgi:RimJ/RimL family protein N-acetyltransferase
MTRLRAIATPRFVLEAQAAAHAEEMFDVLGDPALYAHEGSPPASASWLRERFARLETRRSPDGRDAWLNWVICLPSSALAGYVQATVHPDGHAAIAYVLASRHWGLGLASEAVQAMIDELVAHHGVRTLSAVLKASNAPSRRLLARLGFELDPQPFGIEPDELRMHRAAVLDERPPRR